MDMPRRDFESLNIHGVICIKILNKRLPDVNDSGQSKIN
jgi:hypothetical protein